MEKTKNSNLKLLKNKNNEKIFKFITNKDDNINNIINNILKIKKNIIFKKILNKYDIKLNNLSKIFNKNQLFDMYKNKIFLLKKKIIKKKLIKFYKIYKKNIYINNDTLFLNKKLKNKYSIFKKKNYINNYLNINYDKKIKLYTKNKYEKIFNFKYININKPWNEQKINSYKKIEIYKNLHLNYNYSYLNTPKNKNYINLYEKLNKLNFLNISNWLKIKKYIKFKKLFKKMNKITENLSINKNIISKKKKSFLMKIDHIEFTSILKSFNWKHRYNKKFFKHDIINSEYYLKYNYFDDLNDSEIFYKWSKNNKYKDYHNLIDNTWKNELNYFFYYPYEAGLQNNWIFPPHLLFNYKFQRHGNFFSHTANDLHDDYDFDTTDNELIENTPDDNFLEMQELTEVWPTLIKKYAKGKINFKNHSYFANYDLLLAAKDRVHIYAVQEWEDLFKIFIKINKKSKLDILELSIFNKMFYNSYKMLPYFNYINYDVRKLISFSFDNETFFLKNYLNIRNNNYNFFLKKNLKKDDYYYSVDFETSNYYMVYNNNYYTKSYNLLEKKYNILLKFFSDWLNTFFYHFLSFYPTNDRYWFEAELYEVEDELRVIESDVDQYFVVNGPFIWYYIYVFKVILKNIFLYFYNILNLYFIIYLKICLNYYINFLKFYYSSIELFIKLYLQNIFILIKSLNKNFIKKIFFKTNYMNLNNNKNKLFLKKKLKIYIKLKKKIILKCVKCYNDFIDDLWNYNLKIFTKIFIWCITPYEFYFKFKSICLFIFCKLRTIYFHIDDINIDHPFLMFLKDCFYYFNKIYNNQIGKIIIKIFIEYLILFNHYYIHYYYYCDFKQNIYVELGTQVYKNKIKKLKLEIILIIENKIKNIILFYFNKINNYFMEVLIKIFYFIFNNFLKLLKKTIIFDNYTYDIIREELLYFIWYKKLKLNPLNKLTFTWFNVLENVIESSFSKKDLMYLKDYYVTLKSPSVEHEDDFFYNYQDFLVYQISKQNIDVFNFVSDINDELEIFFTILDKNNDLLPDINKKKYIYIDEDAYKFFSKNYLKYYKKKNLHNMTTIDFLNIPIKTAHHFIVSKKKDGFFDKIYNYFRYDFLDPYRIQRESYNKVEKYIFNFKNFDEYLDCYNKLKKNNYKNKLKVDPNNIFDRTTKKERYLLNILYEDKQLNFYLKKKKILSLISGKFDYDFFKKYFWTKHENKQIKEYLFVLNLEKKNKLLYNNFWKKKGYSSESEFYKKFMIPREEIYDESIDFEKYLQKNKIKMINPKIIHNEKEEIDLKLASFKTLETVIKRTLKKNLENTLYIFNLKKKKKVFKYYDIYNIKFIKKFGTKLNLYERYVDEYHFKYRWIAENLGVEHSKVWHNYAFQHYQNKHKNQKLDIINIGYTFYNWNAEEIFTFNHMTKNILYRLIHKNEFFKLHYELFVIYLFKFNDYYTFFKKICSCIGYKQIKINNEYTIENYNVHLLFDFKKYKKYKEQFLFSTKAFGSIGETRYPYKNKEQLIQDFTKKVIFYDINTFYWLITRIQWKYLLLDLYIKKLRKIKIEEIKSNGLNMFYENIDKMKKILKDAFTWENLIILFDKFINFIFTSKVYLIVNKFIMLYIKYIWPIIAQIIEIIDTITMYPIYKILYLIQPELYLIREFALYIDVVEGWFYGFLPNMYNIIYHIHKLIQLIDDIMLYPLYKIIFYLDNGFNAGYEHIIINVDMNCVIIKDIYSILLLPLYFLLYFICNKNNVNQLNIEINNSLSIIKNLFLKLITSIEYLLNYLILNDFYYIFYKIIIFFDLHNFKTNNYFVKNIIKIILKKEELYQKDVIYINNICNIIFDYTIKIIKFLIEYLIIILKIIKYIIIKVDYVSNYPFRRIIDIISYFLYKKGVYRSVEEIEKSLEVRTIKYIMKLFKRKCDAAYNYQWDFQDPASDIMEGIIDLHHDLMFLLIIIIFFILWFLLRIIEKNVINNLKNYKYSVQNIFIKKKKIKTHYTFIEIFWTLTPAYILTLILVPSLALLYSMDQIVEPNITIKVIGNQWYWTYEYSDFYYKLLNKNHKDFIYNSYITADNDLTYGTLRLLEVDNRVYIPVKTKIRFLVTSTDVLHSWAIPSLGIKIDACPGRLNQVFSFGKRLGTLYGQCSEICGINHGYMPISLDILTYTTFLDFIKRFDI